MFAPAMHTAMRHAMPARRRLGRTAFNLLGPLTNPAGARAQVIGVFSDKVVEKVALVIAELGVERAFVVHGEGGLDEISLAGETIVGEVRGEIVSLYDVTPEDFGLERAPLSAISGGDAATQRRNHSARSSPESPVRAAISSLPMPPPRLSPRGAPQIFWRVRNSPRNPSIPGQPAKNSRPCSSSHPKRSTRQFGDQDLTGSTVRREQFQNDTCVHQLD